jgi:putative sterol carrier protein
MSQDDSEYQLAEHFNKLPLRFKPGKVDRRMLFYFEIEDEKYTVMVESDRCEVAEGEADGEADCYLKTTKEILVRTVRGEYSPSLGDLITGKIKTNRPDLLAVFRQVFID